MNKRPNASIIRRFRWSVAALVLIGGWLWWSVRPQPPPYNLARYSPREALFFIEATSLPTGLRRLETLTFWKAISRAIGFPKQLDDLLTGARLLAWLNVGPAEARLLTRARWGLVVTGLSAEVVPPTAQPTSELKSQPSDDSVVLDVTPRFTLCLTSELPAEQTIAVARHFLPLVARRFLGGDTELTEVTYQGVLLLCFRHPDHPMTALWAAADGTALLLANDEAAVQSCLDAAAGRRAALADLSAFQQARRMVSGEQALLFAFANPAGLGAALRIGTNHAAGGGTVSSNGQAQSLMTSLLAELSDGLGYSLDVQDGQVLDRYYLALHPNVVTALRSHLTSPSLRSPVEQPVTMANSTTYIGLARPLAALDRLQAAVAARSNAAVALFTRELVAGVRERYGIRPREWLDDLLDDQWLLISVEAPPNGKTILGVRVRDRVRLLPTLERYLCADGARLLNPSPNYAGVPLVVSTHSDQRAACFLDNWLFLGNRPALESLLDGFQTAVLPPQSLPSLPAGTFLYRRYRSQADLKTATLALIALTRAGDAVPAWVEEADVRQAIEQQPPATGYLRLEPEGCSGEMRSPIGNLAYLASFLAKP